MKHPEFGDRVINISAGEKNPIRTGIFVRVVRGKTEGVRYEIR